jgi:phosphoribosylaminoimidazole-succinocarboxamide synthase
MLWLSAPVKAPMTAPVPTPTHISLKDLAEPLYRGSVQNLYALQQHPSFMVCETTEAGSVFDVGSIFQIQGNDLNRALFRHSMYGRLAQTETWQRVQYQLLKTSHLNETWRNQLMDGPLQTMLERGATTHHLGMVDAVSGQVIQQGIPEHPSCFNVVRRFPVLRPAQRNVMGNFVFDYALFHQNSTYVVPLEYIVRFGVTSGSSVLKKYQSLSEKEKRGYERELGLGSAMHPWQILERPIYDLTSKYEPEDRAVTKQEALLMSGLSTQHFTDSIKMALLGAWAVREVLEEIGLQLWDLKWEFAVDVDELLFVDTIDADSFRATGTVPVGERQLIIHYNKQAMRDYYRLVCADWLAGVNAAKLEAAHTGQVFKTLLQQGQEAGVYPPTPQVDPEFLAIQAQKTALIKQHIMSEKAAHEIRHGLHEAGLAEVDFYRQQGLLEELLKLNALS